MFFVLENEFADGELWRLRELLDLLDGKIADINGQVANSRDPDSEGLCDRGEYFIGVGFVALQQYLAETIMFTGISKADALKLGPNHESGNTCVEIINSCANWWKHEPESWDKNKVSRNGEKTRDHVLSVSESSDYALSNVLWSFCKGGELGFLSVIPVLEEWRNAVHENRGK